ncbi:MAG: hypothetical protein PVF91_08195 [Chromatiales bacterium]|jgi:hypothetical protein
MRYASRLRFPQLFLLTAGLFLLDLVVPDVVPFADEILLGLLSLMLATWRKPPPRDPSVIEGEVVDRQDGGSR